MGNAHGAPQRATSHRQPSSRLATPLHLGRTPRHSSPQRHPPKAGTVHGRQHAVLQQREVGSGEELDLDLQDQKRTVGLHVCLERFFGEEAEARPSEMSVHRAKADASGADELAAGEPPAREEEEQEDEQEEEARCPDVTQLEQMLARLRELEEALSGSERRRAEAETARATAEAGWAAEAARGRGVAEMEELMSRLRGLEAALAGAERDYTELEAARAQAEEARWAAEDARWAAAEALLDTKDQLRDMQQQLQGATSERNRAWAEAAADRETWSLVVTGLRGDLAKLQGQLELELSKFAESKGAADAALAAAWGAAASAQRAVEYAQAEARSKSEALGNAEAALRTLEQEVEGMRAQLKAVTEAVAAARARDAADADALRGKAAALQGELDGGRSRTNCEAEEAFTTFEAAAAAAAGHTADCVQEAVQERDAAVARLALLESRVAGAMLAGLRSGQACVAELLLQHGAVPAGAEQQRHLLAAAAEAGAAGVLCALLQVGEGLAAQDVAGAVRVAAQRGQLAALEELLRDGRARQLAGELASVAGAVLDDARVEVAARIVREMGPTARSGMHTVLDGMQHRGVPPAEQASLLGRVFGDLAAGPGGVSERFLAHVCRRTPAAQLPELLAALLRRGSWTASQLYGPLEALVGSGQAATVRVLLRAPGGGQRPSSLQHLLGIARVRREAEVAELLQREVDSRA